VYNPQLWHKRKTFVRWFVALDQPLRETVWSALDDAQRAAVTNTKEYRNRIAVERYNDLVGTVEYGAR
jgi:hypothetical protein